MTTTVLLAGATGMFGSRVADHLLDQVDVSLRLLLRTAPTDGAGRPGPSTHSWPAARRP